MSTSGPASAAISLSKYTSMTVYHMSLILAFTVILLVLAVIVILWLTERHGNLL
jgi:hypothetical protein